MHSTEFDSGWLVCFMEIISWAEPQWEIPLYVWLTILAISRSWSCFQSCTPQVRLRSAIFHPYKSETKSIRSFSWGVPPLPLPLPLPLPEYLSIIPDPVNICLAGIQVFLGRTGTFSAPSGNRPMTLIRITGKGSVDSCFYNKTEQNLFVIQRAPDSTYGKKIVRTFSILQL